jgi:hypothetical protein
MYYTIYTMRERSWGGVRVDKNKENVNEKIEIIIS